MRKIMLYATPAAFLAGCQFELPDVGDGDVGPELTLQEARVAVDQVNLSTRGDASVAELVEVSTDFNPEDPARVIEQDLTAYWMDRSECVEVSREGQQIVVDFGTLNDACGFEDNQYAGVDTITIGRDAQSCAWCPMPDDQIGARHELAGFTNGKVTVDGLVDSAFLLEEPDDGGLFDDPFGQQEAGIDVIVDYTLSRFNGEASLDIQGEHTITPLMTDQPFLLGGFQLDGTRNWETQAGTYLLELNNLEVMANAPAPHAGSIDLTDPEGRELKIRYDRVDDNTISARITGEQGEDFTFYVTTGGDLQDGGGQGGQDGGGAGPGGDGGPGGAPGQ
jgi:hypothetical protein